MSNEFKSFDGGKPFLQPEKPFMLVYESKKMDCLLHGWKQKKI